MANFAKGVRVKSQQTKYGEIIKLGINLEEFSENPINERGYINIDILRAKETNKPYAVINTYSNEKTNSQETNEEIIQFDDEEIPF